MVLDPGFEYNLTVFGGIRCSALDNILRVKAPTARIDIWAGSDSSIILQTARSSHRA